MLSFISAALLVYGSMQLYVFGKVWRAVPHSFGLGLALTLAGIALTFSPLLIRYMEGKGWHDATVVSAWVIYTWIGFVFLLFCVCLSFDLAQVFALLLGFKWPANDSMTLVTAGLLAFVALGYGFVEARQIKIEAIKITTPKLAAGRVTIAQISDLHVGIMVGGSFIERITAKLKELRPDIVVATGDIVDGYGDDLDALARRFHGYTPPLGAYAVTGNHERHAGLENSLRFLRSAGFTVLRGESVRVGGIVLAGVDDYRMQAPDRPAKPDAGKSLTTATTNSFIVLLKHQPVVEGDTPFDMQLSGHIHGGQIFPFGYLTRLVYGVHTGLTGLADGRMLYVNRGTGTWGPPIRLFAPPEITLITIESASE